MGFSLNSSREANKQNRQKTVTLEGLMLSLYFCTWWEFHDKTLGKANSFSHHLCKHIPRGLFVEETES